MPETEELVINTGPLLALIAGIGDLSLLELLYKRVLVSFEVCQEIEAGGTSGFGVSEFRKSSFIEKRSNPLTITPFLGNALDLGEASVIQLALDEKIHTKAGSDPDNLLFLQIILPEMWGKKALGCTFGG